MPFRTLTFSLLFSLACLSLSAAPKTERIQFYYGIAEGNYLIGDLVGAERGIEQMLRLDQDYIPALTLKARILLDQGKSTQALETADRTIALEPDKPAHRLLKALILGHMQQHDQARALLQQIIAKAPADSDDARAAQKMLGLLRMAAGEWDQAADAFNTIYLTNPDTAASSLQLTSEAYLEKARTEMQDGAHDEAIAAIDQAIAAYKDQTGQAALQRRTALRLMRARALTKIGRFAAAIRDLQTLTGQQPDNYEARITLASLYASVARWESLEAVIQPLAHRPELQDVARYFEGRAALAKNRVGTARAKFEAALDALPSEADRLRQSLYFYRGICLQRLERQAEATQSILAAIDAGFRPETREEALIASRTLLRAKRARDAIPLLEAITLNRIEPGPDVWAMLGRAHLAADTPTLALSALNESLRVAPANAEVRALRGSLLRKIGDFEGALADYRIALQHKPQLTSIHYECGLAYLQLGQIVAAEESLAQAAAALTDNAGLQLLHALLAYVSEDLDSAKTSLSRYQAQIVEKQNPSALYLDYLLHPDAAKELTQSAVSRYFQGRFTRKQALDAAGRAESAKQARQQICADAFWMAQYEASQGERGTCNELLEIAVNSDTPDLSEYQLAKWQLTQRSKDK